MPFSDGPEVTKLSPGSELENRYSRHALLEEFGSGGQERISRSSVLVVGGGALGSTLSMLLARAGVGRLTVVDRDVLELSNLQRQTLYDEQDLASGLPKAQAAARKLGAMNSEIQVNGLAADFTPRNAERLVADADVVADGTDNFETRYLINDACVKLGKPWIYGGVIGTTGMFMSVVPGTGPCLRCVFPQPPAPGTFPTCDTVGVLNTVPAIIASLEATEVFKILLGAEVSAGRLVTLDAWTLRWHEVSAVRSPDCPTCGKGRYEFLDAEQTSWTTALCGRNAVQITPAEGPGIDLEELGRRLSGVARVSVKGAVLHFEVEGHEIVVFPDGRALVKGLSDEARAKALYTRYVGM